MNNLADLLLPSHGAEALALVQRAAGLLPQIPAVLDTLAAAHALARQHDQAVKVQQRAVELLPGDPTLRLHLAAYLAALGEKDQAREQVRRALRPGLPEQKPRRGRAVASATGRLSSQGFGRGTVASSRCSSPRAAGFQPAPNCPSIGVPAQRIERHAGEHKDQPFEVSMKLNSMRMVFAAALVGTVCSAQALTFSLTGWANSYQVQALNGSAPVSPVTTHPAAGALVGSVSGAPGFNASPFYTYCVELTQWSMPLPFTSSGYSIVDGATYFGSTTIVDRLSRLFTHLGGVGLPTTTTESAARQLAVWEMIYEGSGGLALRAAHSQPSVRRQPGRPQAWSPQALA